MTATDDRLYSAPGAEYMHFDPHEVLDTLIDDEVEVEEWTVMPSRWHYPTVSHLLEWLADHETAEGWWESAYDATLNPEVIAAADALLETMASKITFRMAHKHVATLKYRWEGDDFDDGEYVMISRKLTSDE